MGESDPGKSMTPLRCRCKKFLVVVEGDTLELKCPRCRRFVRIETFGIKGITFTESQPAEETPRYLGPPGRGRTSP